MFEYALSKRRPSRIAHDPMVAGSSTLNVFVPDPESRSFGDLDNLITGVCDGLMAAGAQTQLHPRWGDPEFEDVRPAKPIGILDDSSVVVISATKQRDPEGGSWYRVTSEGER